MDKFIHMTVYGSEFNLGENININGIVYVIIGEEVRGSGRRITLEQRFFLVKPKVLSGT